MDSQDILYTKESGIATITLNRPDKMNALVPGIVEGMYTALEDAVKDDEVRVLILTGAGKAFCAGADISGMAERREQRPEQDSGARNRGGGHSRLNWLSLPLQKCDKPIIASINGVAVGGGLDIALACDIRIASDVARFSEIYIKRGLMPVQGGTFFLPRLVGVDKACQLLLTGDMIDAKEAERIGLVTTVVPHDELEGATWDLAEKIANGPPATIRKIKRAIYDGLNMDLESTLEYIGSIPRDDSTSSESREGIRAFAEKRQPYFGGN
ncbi:MAG: enoyl-CoA hydratase [Dehalococcoidales bacterium]|jgi:enoyl-CoA hydratase/carnithine racemase|nr:enoyl-CoA hydratase [Dehalococcoidales bacterium]MDP6501438.1 enoyl-CoA hydratase [Dehalococcoidales bacterium]MDP6632085.1 enoyl-CoA hydratase [Dehalococcoidales bacterium]MDP6824646.1 enoyl-CoA hydratase [Dehalococcoidales bacterium]